MISNEKTTPKNKQWAFEYETMAFDILESALRMLSDPPALYRTLSAQLRELTDAQGIVLARIVQEAQEPKVKVLFVEPARKNHLIDRPDFFPVIEAAIALKELKIWHTEEASPQSSRLHAAGLEGISIAVPLQHGEMQMGALLLLGLPKEKNLHLVLDVLELLSSILGLVIHNAVLYEEQEMLIQQRTEQLALSNQALQTQLAERQREAKLLQTINQAAREMLHATTTEEIYASVAQSFKQMGFSCVFLNVDEDGRCVSPGYLSYDGKLIQGFEKLAGIKVNDFSMRIDRSAVFFGPIRNRESVFVDDIADSVRDLMPNRFWGLVVKFIDLVGIQYMVNAPLIIEDTVYGMLSVQSQELKQEDVPVVTAFANQVATALHKTRLYQQARNEIADRKRAEQALADERQQLAQRVGERTAELQEMNNQLVNVMRTKDEFMANMSHELRTPLTSIIGMSEVLAMQAAGAMNERQIKYANTINASGEHLLQLINDMLDFSKLEAKMMQLNIQKVDLEALCQSSLEFVRHLANKKEIGLNSIMTLQVTRIDGDSRRLKQILINLLNNAIKFTPQGGQVGLDVSYLQETDEIRFVVWDTGIGVKEDDFERLFMPFTQAESNLSRNYDGTGLGLALVRQLTALHGGKVWMESKGIPGKGTRVIVTLPREQPVSPGNTSS